MTQNKRPPNMYLDIDGRPLIRRPHTIEVVPYDHTSSLTAGGTPLVHPAPEYVTVNCSWGGEATYESVLRELNRLRNGSSLHSITFEPMSGGRYITINAFMGEPKYTHMVQDRSGGYVVSSFTIPFIQIDTPTFLYPMRFKLVKIIGVLSPYTFHYAPAAGRIVAVDGWIEDLGSGIGQTRIQISNGATNYLSTPGDFVCNPPPWSEPGWDRRLKNHVLADDLDFDGGDRIDIDVTSIPTMGLSRNALITVWCWLRRP